LTTRGTYGTFSAVSIERLPSGKYRAVVRHAGAKRASEAAATVAEARMLEARLKLAMGGSAAPRERHTVGEVVAATSRMARPACRRERSISTARD
jgi:hypothetical protein